ncbi:MAG: vanadium-dependent haloperoxidase [Solirubrobacterales bacterium]|nr:vanadium-dependent haloperoxidase [Solirubrobacterales bacterium]
MISIRKGGVVLALAGAALIAPGPAGAAAKPHPTKAVSTVLHWYDLTNQTVKAANYPEPVTQSRAWSVSWLAAARAVDQGHNASFQKAAFSEALHDTLASVIPSQKKTLDAALSKTLAQIPNGKVKQQGIAAGKKQAKATLAQRAKDGLDTASVDAPFTPPAPAPGVWQPTPPTYAKAVRSAQGKAKPFILKSGAQFDPGPPPSLTSKTYLDGLAEVRSYGAANSTVRTPAQTDVAKFWEPAINIQEVQLVRGVLAGEHGKSLSWQSRFVAAFNVVTTDAQIAVYHAKYKYLFWRPVTAIRTGSVSPDPSWTPFFTTPAYPDWVSGHGGVAGSAQAVLTAFVGPNAPAPIKVTSPNDPGVTHTYRNWAAVSDEVTNARVWEGIHFRFSDVTAAKLGKTVAGYDLKRLKAIGL